MNTTSEEMPQQGTPEANEETQVEDTAVEIDDTWVASVLAECDGDVAASIEWLQSQLEGAREDRLRALAELSNNQRRAEENEGRVARASRASAVRALLTVSDQLELALGQNLEGMSAEQFAEGVTLARDEFMKVLGDLGVQRIDPELGEEFNPLRHEAMLKQAADDIESNHITMVMQPGFAMGEQVLRPAKVAIAP
jgi:molecular chaperone GrpE